MISIIVVSINELLFSQLSYSIKNTVGVEYEIIKICNKNSQNSIFQAYNLGVSKSNFDILVFIHEDVVFHSENWGLVLEFFFKTLKNPGVLGIAGSSYLPISPSDWWVPNIKYIHTNFLSNKKDGEIGKGKLKQVGEQIAQEVYALDGMFLAMKKEVFLEFPFDETLIGFHGYDTSICYNVSQKFQNFFVPDILIEHFSPGFPNKIWLQNTIEANRQILPFILNIKSIEFLDKSLEVASFNLFLGQLYKYGKSWKSKVQISSEYFLFVSKFTFSLKLIKITLIYHILYCLQALGLNIKKHGK